MADQKSLTFYDVRKMYYSVSVTGILGKYPSATIRSQTSVLPITSSDALPLSYRGLVGAKAIKLGSWEKQDWIVMCGKFITCWSC